MSRKNYVVIAAVIKGIVERTKANKEVNFAGLAVAEALAINLAREFAAGNARFDRSRFLTACGL